MIKVLQPEDLIGLKIQAFRNHENREHLDLYDLEMPMSRHSAVLYWDLMAEYIHLLELSSLFSELKKKYYANYRA